MMTNQLKKLFLSIINTGLIADGYAGVAVKQANQPTQQGINTQPTVYFYQIGVKRYGFLGRTDVWNNIESEMVHTESQYYETTFQVSALVLQYPQSPSQYTAIDLVNEVASIMQSDNTLAILNSSGIGILRISDISNPHFVDDRDQFESSPFFEFTLVSQSSRVTTTPVIVLPVLLDIHGV